MIIAKQWEDGELTALWILKIEPADWKEGKVTIPLPESFRKARGCN